MPLLNEEKYKTYKKVFNYLTFFTASVFFAIQLAFYPGDKFILFEVGFAYLLWWIKDHLILRTPQTLYPILAFALFTLIVVIFT